jgi:hypothetical protein
VDDDFASLIGAIDTAEANAYGSDEDGDLSADRAQNIEAYLGKNSEPAPDGRSQVVDRSVYETVQWIKPSLARIFANGDDVVEIPPVGPEDEQGAKQESQFLNYVVLQRNNWFEVFDTACSDALLTKAGYLYPYREKRRQVEIERYERQTDQGVALILQDGGQIIEQEDYPDPDYQPQPVMQPDPMSGQPVPVIDPMTGQPAMQPPPMLHDISIRRTEEEVKYCILVLPPERCKISKTCTTVQVRDADYFEYFDFPTISELREMGYDVPDDIEMSTEDSDTEEDTARDQYAENAWATDSQVDPASKRVRCRWIWIKHDHDQDGIAERQYVVRVGNTVLHREEIGRVPIGTLCPDPLPHRHVGLCPADTVLEIQRQKTAILRQGLDNLYLSNNPRTFATGNVNLDDLLVSRPGGIVRGKTGAQFGIDIAPLAVPFVFPQAMEGLAYMDNVRDMRAGVNRNFTGLNEEALGANQSGVAINQLSTMAAQRVEQIARHFAAGIAETFSILHEIILKSGHKPEVVKLRGKWVDVNPAEWRRRTDFKLSVGYAAGNKDAMVQRLMMIAAQQLQALQLGLPIVQPRNIYETNIELAKAADMSTPERFFTDPATVPPPGPPQPDPTVVAVEQMKSQTTKEVKAAEIQSAEKIKAAEIQQDKYKTDTEANVKLALAGQQAEQAKELEGIRGNVQAGLKQMDARHTAEMEKHRTKTTLRLAKAKGAEILPEPEDDVTREEAEEIRQQMGEVMQTVQQLAQTIGRAVTAQRRIKRGKDGRAEGVELVDQDGAVIASQAVVRGADGRIAGSA